MRISALILGIALLSGCGQGESNEAAVPSGESGDVITAEEVVTVLEEQGLELKEEEVQDDAFFARELNDISPEIYARGESLLFVYAFPSAEQRERGLEAFEERVSKSAAAIESYQMFEAANILIFSVEGQKEMNSAIEDALEDLS